MKRLISALLVLLALGVAAFFFIKLRRFLPERSRAAELAPADTVLFVQVPDLRETAFQVPGLDLYALWMDPEVQAFLEKPRKKSPWLHAWEERYDEVVRVAPGEMFVAFTALAPHAEFVGGFSFAGSRQSAETLVEKSKSLLPGKVVSKPHGNWLFFASDETALAAEITRYEAKVMESALSGDPAFQRALKALGPAPDFVIYGRPSALPFPTGSLPPTATAAMATKIQKGKLHDTIYLPTRPAASAKITEATLALTTPQTLAYFAGDISSVPLDTDLSTVKALFPPWTAAENALEAKGLSWKDLPTAFGLEIGLIVDWPDDAALPGVVLAPKVRDAAKAQVFLEAVTAPGSSVVWRSQVDQGVTVYSAAPQGFSLLRPAVALTDRFALAGSTSDALTSVLRRSKKSTATLKDSPAFQDATRLWSADPNSFAYLDFPRVFERLYRMSRPFLTLSLAFSPEASEEVDAGKLPPAEAIAKHLRPLVVTQTTIENGTLIESTGSITFTELAAAGAMAAAAGGPAQLPIQLPSLLPLKSLFSSPSNSATPQPAATPDRASPSRENGR